MIRCGVIIGIDADYDGLLDAPFVDANFNGYSDALETTPLVIPDTDGDGKRAFQDLDSDNDSILDIFENWFC